MPRKPDKGKWEKAAARYEEIDKKLRPYVRRAKENEAPLEESWRPTGELQGRAPPRFRKGRVSEFRPPASG